MVFAQCNKVYDNKKNVSLVFGRQLHISSHKQFFFSIWVNLNCKLCEFVVDQMLLMFCWQLSQPQFSTSTLRPCIIAPVQTSREKMEMEKKNFKLNIFTMDKVTGLANSNDSQFVHVDFSFSFCTIDTNWYSRENKLFINHELWQYLHLKRTR